MSDRPSYRRKNPWLAAALSFIPGLGQMYNEQFAKGMGLLLTTGLTFLGVILLPVFAWSLTGLPLLALVPLYFIVVLPALVIYSVFDAYFRALHLRETTVARPVGIESSRNGGVGEQDHAQGGVAGLEREQSGVSDETRSPTLPGADRAGLLAGAVLTLLGTTFLVDRLWVPIWRSPQVWRTFLEAQLGLLRAFRHWFDLLWPLLFILAGLWLLRRKEE